LEHLGRQAMFKFQALWSVRDGKGLIMQSLWYSHKPTPIWCHGSK